MKSRRRVKKKTKRDFEVADCEWNFDKPRVSDTELMACCLWEYARESRALRDLRQKCEQAWREEGGSESMLPIVAGTIRHPNNSVELFLREMVLRFPPMLWQDADPSRPFYTKSGSDVSRTDAFPNPWQSQSTNERHRLAGLVDLKIKPYFAFRRGRLRDAQAIVRTVMEQRKVALNPDINPLCVSWIATHSPLVDQPRDWTDETRLPAGFFYPDGTELSVVEIDWVHFTNKEIGDWIAKHRPHSIPEPKDRGGHKTGDWRASLMRLGLLRLRHALTVEETIQVLCKSFSPKKRLSKFTEPGEINREAKKAADDFRDFFPFLEPVEKPISWR